MNVTYPIGHRRIVAKKKSSGGVHKRFIAEHGKILVILRGIGGQDVLGVAHDGQHPRFAVVVTVC